MKEPVFNPGGLLVVIWIVGTVAILFAVGAGIRAALLSGHYWWVAAYFPVIFVLGYFVGNERDKADYHKIIAWVASRLGWR